MPDKSNTQPPREQDGLLDRIIHHHHENQEKKDQKEARPNEGRHDQPSKESELGKLKNYLQEDEAKLKDYLREDEKLEEEGRTYGGLM